MTRRAPALVVAAALVLAATLGACSPDGPGAGEAELRDVRGVVETRRHDGGWRRTGGGTVGAGTQVRVRDGGVELVLGGGGVLELRDGSVVEVGRSPSLMAGDVLAVAGEAPLTVHATSTRVRVVERGAVRLSRRLGFDAAAYRGTLAVTSARRSIAVNALRQVAIPAPGLVPARPSPLRYRETDEWDRRFLGDAMALSRELDGRSRGVSGFLPPGDGGTPGFYRLVLPALGSEPAFTAELLAGTDAAGTQPLPAGEKLVGAAIALHGDRGGFTDRWRAVFSFRRDGAEWGLVALDQQVEEVTGLVGDLDLAIGRLTAPPQILAAPAAAGFAGGGGGTAPGAPAPPPASPSPASPPSVPSPTTPPTSPPPTNPPPPDEPPPVLPPPPESGVPAVDQLTSPLVSTVEGVLDSLLAPVPPL